MAMFQRVRPSYVIGGVAAAGIGLTLLSQNLMSEASASTGAPRKVFPGGPAFVSLPLESSEMVNHNTKRLRFKLPEPDSVTGLPLECKCRARARAEQDIQLTWCMASFDRDLRMAQRKLETGWQTIHPSHHSG